MSKSKDHKALVGRVKKAVKKTRRKLSEEQFDKELQRTISFLSELKEHVHHLQPKGKTTQDEKPKPKPVADKKIVAAKAKAVPADASAKAAKPKK
ncbi:MAG: hypothetical protein HOP19_03730 [Acidobacteria bacterium]|nr:hypothetical protein [Acidobacteriota bacterium]